MEKPNLFIGLIDISFIDLIREAIIKKISSYNIKLFKMLDVEKKINHNNYWITFYFLWRYSWMLLRFR